MIPRYNDWKRGRVPERRRPLPAHRTPRLLCEAWSTSHRGCPQLAPAAPSLRQHPAHAVKKAFRPPKPAPVPRRASFSCFVVSSGAPAKAGATLPQASWCPPPLRPRRRHAGPFVWQGAPAVQRSAKAVGATGSSNVSSSLRRRPHSAKTHFYSAAKQRRRLCQGPSHTNLPSCIHRIAALCLACNKVIHDHASLRQRGAAFCGLWTRGRRGDTSALR